MSESLPLLLVLVPALGAVLALALPDRASRTIASGIALAVFALTLYACTNGQSYDFQTSWFRFQNLTLEIRFAILPGLEPLLPFVAGIGALACLSLPRLSTEQPRLQNASCLLWLASSLGVMMADDLIVLFVLFEFAILASMFCLVVRRRDDAATSATALLAPMLLGATCLLCVVLLVTSTPLPIDAGELALSSSLAATRGAFLSDSTTANWILLALAIAALTRAGMFPAHWFWLMLQHRMTAGGSLLALGGGVAVATWIFVELAANYAVASTWWGAASLDWIFVLGMLGLGITANLHGSLRRRAAATVLLPLLIIPLALVRGTAEGFALATVAVLAIGLPACSLLLAFFAYGHRRRPGRLRDLRGSGRRMPRFGILCALAIALCFGVPGSASYVVLRRVATQLAESSLPLTICAAVAALAVTLALVVLLLSLVRAPTADRRTELEDLNWAEVARIAAPLLAVLILAFFVDAMLEAQQQAFVDRGLKSVTVRPR